MSAKISSTTPARRWRAFLSIAGLLALILSILFYRSFIPKEVAFSNDGPLGGLVEAQNQLPQTLSGMWTDLNSIGYNPGATAPSISSFLRLFLGPVGFAKFFPVIALFILGLGAWTFFRALKLCPSAAVLGSLAAMLNSTFFTTACWGVASQQIALAVDFFALALIVANTNEARPMVKWMRFALAGLCVGMNVMEAADIGALYSLFVAAFAFFNALVNRRDTILVRTARGIGHVMIIAIFAGFIAFQTVISLVGTQIQGVVGTSQDEQTKTEHWDYATQWSLPKQETLGLFIPGLFGYRMDTPKDMMPEFADMYKNGVYWGGMGRSPALDRWLDNGQQGEAPPGIMRFSGGGCYCGILVWLVAAWVVIQLFRKENSLFERPQKWMIGFWAAMLVICLPLAWGRFAPFSENSDGFLFYALLYKLPYFSTIRSPSKFLIFISLAVVVLFAYGIHALSNRYLKAPASRPLGLSTQLKYWWSTTDNFNRKWTRILLGIFGASILGWLIYSSQKKSLVHYLQNRGFVDADLAQQIAAFSITQAGWFLVLFAIAIAIVTLILAGYFTGVRAKVGIILLGGFLAFDLGRANLPYIIHWDYKQKYEVGSLNPVETFLSEKPYEHRVAKLLPAPLSTPSQFQLFDQLYGIEWTQHHFPYYNIQSLDIIQMPRMPEDLAKYMKALRIGIKQNADGQYMLDDVTFPRLTRLWELTNTRYLLGPAPFLNLFNAQFDPVKHRFHILQRFTIGLKPDVLQFHQRLEELTAYETTNGEYALFDFSGALPRAKLYSNWRVDTNDQEVLKTLANLNFNPHQTVMVDTPEQNLPTVATNTNIGTVKFKSYQPKTIVFDANATNPSVLLLNDKYDSNWHVTVDGQPAKLLRCNYIMRGVFLQPGAHTVTFHFYMPSDPLYVTLTAIGVGFVLSIGLLVATRKSTSYSESSK